MSGWLQKLTQFLSGGPAAAANEVSPEVANGLPRLLRPFAVLAGPDPLTSPQLVQNLNGLLAALCPPGAYSRAVRIRVGEAIQEHLKVKRNLLVEEVGDGLIDFAMAPERGSRQTEGRDPVTGIRQSLLVTTEELRQAIPKLIRDKLPTGKPEELPLREGIALADGGFRRFAARNPGRALKWLEALAGMERPAGLPVDQWRELAASHPSPVRPSVESFEPAMRTALAALLQQIERAPGDHRLGPPASEEILADWEAETGGPPLPADLRALYRYADGMWLFREEWVIRPLQLRDRATAPVMDMRDPQGTIHREADGTWIFHHSRQRKVQSVVVGTSLPELIGYLLSRVIEETSVFMGVDR